MALMLRGIEFGHRYVSFDAYVLPTDADGVTMEGLHSRHALAVVPQVEALRDRSIVDGLLSNPSYWRATALEEKGWRLWPRRCRYNLSRFLG